MLNDNNIITTCPQCKTQFHVTQGQLKIAHGQVRCGNCLHIFLARAHEKRKTITKKSKTDNQAEQNTACSTLLSYSAPTANDKIENDPTLTTVTLPTEEIQVTRGTKQASPTYQRETKIITAPSNPTPIPTLIIEKEAIILSSSPKSYKSNAFFWSIALLIAMLGLISQYLWFNRTELYWQSPYQPLYQTLCNRVDCHIPQRFALEKIQNKQLTILPHPIFSNAINANLLLVNYASFEQPYPAIKLIFSNLKGKVIALRTFQPRDYLNSTPLYTSLLPTNKPTQISIALLSPSTRAINYKVELLAPEQ